MASQYIFDSKIYHRGRPNSRHRVGEEEFRYNSAGFRDIERVREKRKDVFRVALIGDSFVEGYECAYESTVGPALQRLIDGDAALQSLLRRRGLHSVEVIPFGLGGFCPSFYSGLLEAHCLQYEPDLIYVNVFSFNDIAGMVPFKERIAGGGYRTPYADYFAIREGELVLEHSMLTSYRRHLRRSALHGALPISLLKRLIQMLPGNAKTPALKDSWMDQYSGILAKGLFAYLANEPETARAYALCSAFFKKMEIAAESVGARLTIVHLANADQLDPDLQSRELASWRRFTEGQSVRDYNDDTIDFGLPGRRLKEGADQWNLDFLDLNEYLLAEPDRPNWMELFAFRTPADPADWTKWGHYTAAGNQAWARMLHDHVTRRLDEQLIRRRGRERSSDDYNPYLYPLY